MKDFEVLIQFDDDEEIKRSWFNNYMDAQNEFFDYVNCDNVRAIIVISHVLENKEGIILAYSNDWNDEFIKIPEWAC